MLLHHFLTQSMSIKLTPQTRSGRRNPPIHLRIPHYTRRRREPQRIPARVQEPKRRVWKH
jgi:hypothetical protein